LPKNIAARLLCFEAAMEMAVHSFDASSSLMAIIRPNAFSSMLRRSALCSDMRFMSVSVPVVGIGRE
jgi:hypothetical protein